MDLSTDPADEAFRADVRRFLREHLPTDLAARNRGVYHPTREDTARWTAILHEQGWSAPGWPREFGGTGWTLSQQNIFNEECYAAGTPRVNLQGFSLVGPVIYTYGTAQQKERFLPGILNGQEIWTQGFSEPNAGSDLAALRTRAERRDDHYVVNGQKIWTSDAHKADWCFCLVRTDPAAKPQRGISFLLIDMRTPGITVRPIVSIDDGHGLNEVFFDDVKVPLENLVGEENMGWTYAKHLLGIERAFTAAELPYCKHTFRRILELARTQQRDGHALITQGDLAIRLARTWADIQALEFSMLRVISGSMDARNWPLASLLKIKGSELQQRLSQFMVELMDGYGVVRYPGWDTDRSGMVGPAEAPGVAADFFYRRAATIYGGSNEIQRNIIAKNILGL